MIDVLAQKDEVFYQVLVATPRDAAQHKAGAVKIAETLLKALTVTRTRPAPAVASAAAAPGLEVVADDELPQPADVGGEHPPAGPARDGVDEAGQARVVAEHERVERGAVAGQLVDLGDRGPDRLGRARPLEPRPAVTGEVRGGLAVGHDQDDGLRVGVAAQVPGGQQQGVLQVGALDPLRLGLGELHRA